MSKNELAESRLFTPAIADLICARTASGTPLAEICRSEGMPSDRTVRLWLSPKSRHFKGDAFAQAMAVARDMGYDAIAEECYRISNTPQFGEEVITKSDGTIETRRGDMLGHRKFQVEVRLKLLSKWSPRYADKVEATHSVAGTLEAILLAGMARDAAGK